MQRSMRESRSSSSKQKDGVEVTFPVKNPSLNKRKGGPPTQVYRKVATTPLAIKERGEGHEHEDELRGVAPEGQTEDLGTVFVEREPKKKKPTPPSSETSAATASQRCPMQ